MEPELLALTDSWCVVNKPAGWLTIPGRGPATPVVTDWAKRAFGPVWVVHRLDRETSGVLLMARTEGAHRDACGWFESRRVRKEYDALAIGRPADPVFRVDLAMPDGRPAKTQIEVRHQGAGGFLARARPVTGRRHQIRFHLSESGHPIWGDPAYDGPEVVEGLGAAGGMRVNRVALHASLLELPERKGRWEAPWPPDFEGWARELKASR